MRCQSAFSVLPRYEIDSHTEPMAIIRTPMPAVGTLRHYAATITTTPPLPKMMMAAAEIRLHIQAAAVEATLPCHICYVQLLRDDMI